MAEKRFVYVGIDVSKLTLDVCIPNRKCYLDPTDRKKFEYKKISNNELEINKLLKTLNGKRLGLVVPVKERNPEFDYEWCIVVENTGIYHKLIERITNLTENQNISVMNSHRVKNFIKANAVKRQTDKIDSFLLYMMGVMTQIQPSKFDKNIEELKIKLAVERRIKKMLQQYKPLKENLFFGLDKQVVKSIEKENKVLGKLEVYYEAGNLSKCLDYFDKNLYLFDNETNKEIINKVNDLLDKENAVGITTALNLLTSENEIRIYYKNERSTERNYLRIRSEITNGLKERYGTEYECVSSVPGIGEVLTNEIIIATNCFTKFDSVGKFLSYCGLVPSGKDSGTSVKSNERISNMVNRDIRHMIVSAGWIASKHNEDCRNIFTRLIANGKNKRLANIASARKLMIQAYICGSKRVMYKSEFKRGVENEECK